MMNRDYPIRLVEKEEIFPELGYAILSEACCEIRKDLPELVKKGVVQHEYWHLRLKTRSEAAAIVLGFITAPIASLSVVAYALFNAEQRQGIIAAIKKDLKGRK